MVRPRCPRRVARLKGQVEAHRRNLTTQLLFTSFDYIDAFSKLKESVEAGKSEARGIGLPWRTEDFVKAMEHAYADSGQAVGKFFANVRERRIRSTTLCLEPR